MLTGNTHSMKRTMGYPHDPKLRGLAAVTFRNTVPCWEFDICAVPDGEDVTQVSDWHRRHGRANNKDGNVTRAAQTAFGPKDKDRTTGHER